MTAFTSDQVRRYSRHVLLPDVGGIGQSRLLAAAVVVDGSGAAGRLAAMFLVAAGVGTVIVDGALDAPVRDARFPLTPGDTGRSLAEALAGVLGGHNPDVRVIIAPASPDRANAARALLAREPDTLVAGEHRLTIAGDRDDLPLAAAFARAGEATSSLVHRIATGAAP